MSQNVLLYMKIQKLPHFKLLGWQLCESEQVKDADDGYKKRYQDQLSSYSSLFCRSCDILFADEACFKGHVHGKHSVLVRNIFFLEEDKVNCEVICKLCSSNVSFNKQKVLLNHISSFHWSACALVISKLVVSDLVGYIPCDSCRKFFSDRPWTTLTDLAKFNFTIHLLYKHPEIDWEKFFFPKKAMDPLDMSCRLCVKSESYRYRDMHSLCNHASKKHFNEFGEVFFIQMFLNSHSKTSLKSDFQTDKTISPTAEVESVKNSRNEEEVSGREEIVQHRYRVDGSNHAYGTVGIKYQLNEMNPSVLFCKACQRFFKDLSALAQHTYGKHTNFINKFIFEFVGRETYCKLCPWVKFKVRNKEDLQAYGRHFKQVHSAICTTVMSRYVPSELKNWDVREFLIHEATSK